LPATARWSGRGKTTTINLVRLDRCTEHCRSPDAAWILCPLAANDMYQSAIHVVVPRMRRPALSSALGGAPKPASAGLLCSSTSQPVGILTSQLVGSSPRPCGVHRPPGHGLTHTHTHTLALALVRRRRYCVAPAAARVVCASPSATPAPWRGRRCGRIVLLPRALCSPLRTRGGARQCQCAICHAHKRRRLLDG
jgi:hypothetical protein